MGQFVGRSLLNVVLDFHVVDDKFAGVVLVQGEV